MNKPTLRINELCLRVPGLNPRDANHLAQQVAQQLAVQLPGSLTSQQIGALELRLSSPDTDRSKLPSNIARAVTKRIT